MAEMAIDEPPTAIIVKSGKSFLSEHRPAARAKGKEQLIAQESLKLFSSARLACLISTRNHIIQFQVNKPSEGAANLKWQDRENVRDPCAAARTANSLVASSVPLQHAH
jgi:hypothetical protein